MATLPEKARTQLDLLVDAFRSGKIAEAVSKQLIAPQPQDESRPIDSWSLTNRILCWLSGTSDARGYRQWQEAGRHVQKGSRAVYILAPVLVKIRDESDDEEEDGNEPDEPRKVLRGFRAIPVFRYEDTDGEPLPEADYAPAELPPLYEVAQSLGIQVRYAPGKGNCYGAYNIQRDEILLFTHDRQTFWHELAHAAHRRCLPEQPLKGGQDAAQEAIAELSAAVLARLYGVPNDGYSYDYLTNYSGDGEPAGLALRVVAQVEKVLGFILEQAQETTAAAA